MSSETIITSSELARRASTFWSKACRYLTSSSKEANTIRQMMYSLIFLKGVSPTPST